MEAELIAIGTELMLGATVDTNSSWMARQLTSIGVPINQITLVGDDREQLVKAIREAWERTQLVVCMGGLGPTADDLTREAVAEAVGRPLQFHQDLLDYIEARFKAFGRRMSESNRQQAFVPEGARPIQNSRGTAPIFLLEDAGRALIVLPGVPSEMQFLTETVLLPYLRDERGIRTATVVRSVFLSGLSEAEAGEKIADLMLAPYPVVGISAKAAQYEVRIAARHEDTEQAQADADAVAAEIQRRLQSYVLNRGILESEVAGLLREHHQTIAVYEGMRRAPVYTALGRIEHGLEVIRGVTIHPLDEPVDPEGAATLVRSAASDVRENWQADYGVAIQPARPEADGWSTVQIAVASENEVFDGRRRIDLNAREAVGFIATAALELLRTVINKQGS